MSKKFFARGSDGLISISSGSLTEAQLDDPLNHLSNIFLHTDLEYMKAAQVYQGTVEFPLRTTDTTEPRRSVIEQEIIATFAIGQLLTPMFFGFFSDGKLLCDFTPIQQVSGSCWRAVGLQCDDNNVRLIEYYISYGAALSAISKDYTILILGQTDIAFDTLET